MEVHQVVIRAQANTVIVLYDDALGNRDSVVFDATGNASVAQLLADCAQRLPRPDQNPARARIEAEIAEMEERIRLLRAAITAPPP